MLSVVCVSIVTAACGKKGPPLPPLVKLPAPPGDFTAARRGDTVDLQFTVPNANTDGTRPANVERVDVYAYTGTAGLADDQVLKLATRVGTVPVKAPRDPNLTVEPDEPSDDIEPPQGPGLDQGATARVEEPLTTASLDPVHVPNRSKAPPDERGRPLVGPPDSPVTRNYVAVGIARRGRRGGFSKRAAVPLVPPPPAPPAPTIANTETEITLSWSPRATPPAESSTDASSEPAVLPSRALGRAPLAEVGYHVYQVGPDGETRLSRAPAREPKYADTRLTWGAERCYVVRTVETIGSVAIESNATPRTCVTPIDTFPPAAPKELHAVAGEHTINLIWEPNSERDLAGYLVLRGEAPGDSLEPLTPSPIADARFTDEVRPGVRYVYAVRAVDKAGNVSPLSNRVEETAR